MIFHVAVFHCAFNRQTVDMSSITITAITEIMQNIVEIVHEMSEKRYFVPHKWLVDILPVLARMLEWQSRFGQEKVGGRQILHLPKDVYFGKMTDDLFEHLIEFACCIYFGRSAFDFYVDELYDMNSVLWHKMSAVVGLADYLGVKLYVDELSMWIKGLDLSLFAKYTSTEWFRQLLQAYHEFVYRYPEDHREIAKIRTAIVTNLGNLQSKCRTCSCQKCPEIPRINGDFYFFVFPGNEVAVNRYWKDMEHCTLTTLFKQSQWTVNTLASFVIDIDHCYLDRDVGPHCGIYSPQYIALLHYWLAKRDQIDDVEFFVECCVLFRKSDIQRRRVILESLFRYTGMQNNQLQSSLNVLDEWLHTLDIRWDATTCHNCLNLPTPYHLRLSGIPVKCYVCRKQTCILCRSECHRCKLTMCFSCSHYFTCDNISKISEPQDLLLVKETYCKHCLLDCPFLKRNGVAQICF